MIKKFKATILSAEVKERKKRKKKTKGKIAPRKFMKNHGREVGIKNPEGIDTVKITNL